MSWAAEVRFPAGAGIFLCHFVHIGCGFLSDGYRLLFPRRKIGRSMKLTTNFRLVSRLRMIGDLRPPPRYAFLACCFDRGTPLLLSLPCGCAQSLTYMWWETLRQQHWQVELRSMNETHPATFSENLAHYEGTGRRPDSGLGRFIFLRNGVCFILTIRIELQMFRVHNRILICIWRPIIRIVKHFT